MARLYLVRHGQAASTWAEAHDPGLSPLGREEAEAAARALAPKGPLAILSSPLARARETAAPLERLWETHARIEPGVAEVPSPDIPLDQRGDWLRAIMAGAWSAADAPRRAWKDSVVACLVAQRADCAIFSHFVAINVAVGAALDDDTVVHFSPGNGSITVLETDGRRLTLIEKGREAATVVR
ncbi:MAG: histidine phosphatase family protein [Alphaproteobacteria bacterium]|nr:histidine phosphatase family protein [Alphaproteobacteria bacterium]